MLLLRTLQQLKVKHQRKMEPTIFVSTLKSEEKKELNVKQSEKGNDKDESRNQ